MNGKSYELKRRTLLASFVTFGLGATAAAAQGKCTGARIEIYKSGNKWRWRLFAINGEQIAEHSQPYDSEAACRKGIESVKRNLSTAPIVMKSGCKNADNK